MSAAGQPQSVAPGQGVPVYDVAASERTRASSNFEQQREAILKAVEAQRQAAMGQAAMGQALAPGRAAAQGRPPASASAPAVNFNPAAQQAANRQQAVAVDIVMALKAMVAEEVRLQLVALLAAAEARQKNQTAAAAPVSVSVPVG